MLGMREAPKKIRSHRDLDVYQLAFETAMRIFAISRSFPPEERYSLTDQIRRCSRSVCTNASEGWRKRKYPAAFVSKLSDAEGEAAETQVWLDFAFACEYITEAVNQELSAVYDRIIGKLVTMALHPDQWSFHH
jgi:four helix bundle protein